MAEIVVTSAVTVLLKKLLSGDLKKLTRSVRIKSRLQKLKTKWTYIEAVLADASERHITQEAVKVWLLDLHRLAYDIEDVLDDLATESLRRKVNDELRGSTSTGKVLKKTIPSFSRNFTPHNMKYVYKMRSMLDEITEKLNGLYENKNIHGIDSNTIAALRSNKKYERPEETSLLDGSPVLGREKDEAAVLEKLLGDESCNQNVSVVSIIGFGGVGKTTLARLLYNNQKVKDHFQLKAWVCVSEGFDVLAVSKAIYQAVTGEDNTPASLNRLQEVLKDKLSNKRFLLVLDDVWNEDHQMWKDVEKPLKGAPGSKIIVTTRKITVASAMGSVEHHNLGLLSDEDALSLLAKSAIGKHNFDNHPLLSLAQGIIKKCKGLPLALLAIGRVLNGKKNDEDEWKKLLENEIWSSDDKNNILPALKLSYYDLPLHLKQLFSYCSFFPKDYLFKKDKLVLLWMAEGFLSQSKGGYTMESLGRQDFEDLRSRSFFQHSTNNKSEYIMHDLMNDLAISVAGEFFFMLDDKKNVNGRNEAFDIIRHFSFLPQPDEEFINFKELHRSRLLRTFLPVKVNWWSIFKMSDHVLVKLLPRLQLLRVLSFNRCSIQKVPQSIGGLKHLRYLNFSDTSIKEVPGQVGELYNLQTLLVCNCSELFKLPVSFSKLINLRHLDMSDTPKLEKTPLGICGLTSLQTLTKVFIKRANGFKISDLEGLVNLEGHLSIYGLEKVADSQQAIDANLEGKKGLVSLEMEWGDYTRNLQTEYEVIEGLRPPRKLNKLKIWNYGGMKFPSWFANPSFDKLTELRIKGCKNCTHFDGIAFPLLEYLEVSDMEVLEKWSNCDGDKTTGSFLRLREIFIISCPKLAEVSIGLIPTLEVLVLKECSEVVLRAMVAMSPTIKNLAIRDIENLKELDVEVLKHLGAVEILKIEYCYELKKVNVGSSNTKCVLRDVYLSNCSSLESYNCPNTVERLEIRYCESMTSFTLSLPSSLKVLNVYDCENLKSICDELPSSLEVLKIEYCKSMTSLTLSLPSSLKLLKISVCENLKSISDELPSSLEVLEIWHCDNIKSFPDELPSSLEVLKIGWCKNLKSFPHEHLQSLTSLQVMTIDDCPSMDELFPCGLWPPNLRVLKIGKLKKPLSEFGLQKYPTSLVTLYLYGSDSGVTSFAMEGEAMNTASTCFLLPPSLTHLSIWEFKDVKSISEELLQQHLTHLQYLGIHNCPNIRDVPQSTSSLTVVRVK